MAVWGGLTNSWEKEEKLKAKDKRKDIPIWMQFQRTIRRDKKVFLSEQCKEIEESNRMGNTRDLFKKIRDTNGTFGLQCRRSGFSLWVGKIPWRRKWQPTPVLLPGKFYGLRSLVGYCPWDRKESDITEWLHFHFQGNISCKDGHNKGQKQYGPNRSRRYKKRWQEYTEELYKKDLSDSDSHDGVITHLESDILECKVKWASRSITMNKASGGDGSQAKLFQILKDDAVKLLHSIC